MAPESRTKENILKRLHTERKRLLQNLATLTDEQMQLPGVVGEWCVKDVLAHLADWQSRMPLWIEAGRRGEPTNDPAPDLTWRQVHVLNQRIYEAHRHEPLKQVLEFFHQSYKQFIDMVEQMPDDEMLTVGRYAMTGERAVYDWFVGYANHDLWAKRAIRKWLRKKQASPGNTLRASA